MRFVQTIESVKVGIDSLFKNPFRTLLSTTGVVIGVMALVATLSLTDGVDRWARSLIERESSVQDIVLSPRSTVESHGRTIQLHHVPAFTLEDWRSATRSIPYIIDSVLVTNATSTVRTNRKLRSVLITASTPNLPAFSDLEIATGRYFSEPELTRQLPVIVVGHRLATEMASPRDPAWLIGRAIRVGDDMRTVIGVASPHPGETELQAFVPIGRLDLLPRGQEPPPTVLRLKAQRVEDVEAARDATLDWIARRFPLVRNGIDVNIGLERLQRTQQAMLLTRLIFGVLVTLTLCVGGIGIMNVQLAAVAERTREIGIRRAIGAIVAVASAAVFRSLTGAGIVPAFTVSTVLLVVAAALIVGVGFGTHPARLAAGLTPIKAIQRE